MKIYEPLLLNNSDIRQKIVDTKVPSVFEYN